MKKYLSVKENFEFHNPQKFRSPAKSLMIIKTAMIKINWKRIERGVLDFLCIAIFNIIC